MSPDQALSIIANLLKLGLLLCAPLLAVILLVGLFVSVIQVVTQIQDQSVSFVPKLVVFIVALILLSPWMLARLTTYGVAMFSALAIIGR